LSTSSGGSRNFSWWGLENIVYILTEEKITNFYKIHNYSDKKTHKMLGEKMVDA
jgi:hypothetical protein